MIITGGPPAAVCRAVRPVTVGAARRFELGLRLAGRRSCLTSEHLLFITVFFVFLEALPLMRCAFLAWQNLARAALE